MKEVITLTERELQHAHAIAHGRNAPKQAAGVVDQRFDPNRTSFGVQLAGYLGELAVAKALGISTDTSLHLSGDNGTDLSYRGYSLQVKTRIRRANGDLIFPVAKPLKADVAVLVIQQSESEYLIAGIIGRSRFYRISKPLFMYNGECLAVGQKDLLPLQVLRIAKGRTVENALEET